MMKITKQSLGKLVLTSTLFIVAPIAFSATTISSPTVIAVPYLTSNTGDITIASTGSIVGPASVGIIINTPVTNITIDPNNINSSAINTGLRAILIEELVANITVGANSTVQGAGIIASINADSSSAVILNNGNMISTGNVTAIFSQSSLDGFDSITNNGSISSGGTVIGITAFSQVVNSITNTGSITAGIYGILADNSSIGSIMNSGSITASAPGIFIFNSGSVLNGIVNSGSIIGGNYGILLALGSTLAGGINNSGQISGNVGIQANVGSSLTGGITNSGTIIGTGGTAINVGALTNNVLITNNAPGVINGDVIVSSDSAPGTVLQMNGGTINGVVLALAAAAPRTFNITGGTITGGIDLSASTPNTADIINQSGGTVGPITGNNSFFGGNQTLNILGPVTTGGTIGLINTINVPTGVDFTINHNVFSQIQFNVPGGTVTNNSSFFVGGPNDVLSITAGGTFINNGSFMDSDIVKVSGSGSSFTNMPGGNFVTGSLTVDTGSLFAVEGGSVGVGSGGLTVNSGATYKAGIGATTTVNQLSINNSTFEVEIQDPANYGSINILGAGVSNITNSTVQVDLVNLGSHLFLSGELYTIINNTGAGTITRSFNIVTQPASATIQFVDVSTPQDIILQVVRSPFVGIIGDNDITIPPATSIDAILNSGQPITPEFAAFIVALDGLNAAQINAALTTVVPQYDGGLVRLSHMLQHGVFDGLGKYIDEHRAITSLIPCYIAGDVGMGRWSGLEYSRGTWGKVFASRVLQKDQGLSDGYDLEDIGVIFGYDQYCSDRVVLGGALSYATGNVFSKALSQNEQSVKSFQLTTYSTYDYKGPGYLDMMAAVAFNNYDSTRNIIAGSFLATSTAEFTAWNYGVNIETGYRFSQDKYRIIPLVRFMYSRLRIDNYTEMGAGGLSLSVLNEPVEEGITAIGIKFNSTNFYQEAAYIPEFRFNIIYDWINDGQSMTSNFLEGGPPFITNAIRPHPCIYNIGMSLTALASESTVFVIDYNLDLQRDFVAHNISMKFRYEW